MKKEVYHVPSDKHQRDIKRLLNIPRDRPFPRCAAKSEVRLKKLEAKGEMEHRPKKHAPCNECMCDHVAGWGTRGDFYGYGEELEMVGHYGIGFCKNHEKGRNAAHAETVAIRHMKMLQQEGKSPKYTNQYLARLRVDSEEADQSLEIRAGMQTVINTLAEFEQAASDDSKTLTEKFGPTTGDMTDKTRMELACTIAKTLSTLCKDKFTIESSDMIHFDDVKTRVFQTITLAQISLPNKEEFNKFVDEYQKIWQNVQRG